jgi:hypothetical protein
MSVEGQQTEQARFLEYQRSMREKREATIGIATVLFLATIDLGLSSVGESAVSEAPYTPSEKEGDQTAEVIDLGEARRKKHRKKLGLRALQSPELGYADAA